MNKIFYTIVLLLLASWSLAFINQTPPNPNEIKKMYTEYHDSGRYQNDIIKVSNAAQDYLQQRLASRKKEEKLAIVFDIDETLLSNYEDLRENGFGLNFSADLSDFHMKQMNADAPSIQPVNSLYAQAQKNKVTVFLITGRSELQRKHTVFNLYKVGLKNWQHLYMKPSTYRFKTIDLFKSHIRKKITDDGYKIIINIGDQCSDLKGGYAEKAFKLPNPFYYIP